MTGEDLYNLYVQEFASRNCAVDSWEEMAEIDRSVWNALAKGLQGA